MKIGPDTHLTYCLNVHPGDSWESQRAAIAEHALAIKTEVAPRRSFGLGLRLSHAAASTLADPAELASLRNLLAAHDMYAFTINGFPYGTFHGRAVKANVYLPDWSETARLDYTLRLAELLAALLPEGVDGSISTVPVSYRGWLRTASSKRQAVENLARTAAGLHDIAQRTGREIHLGLEPEPDCVLETTSEVVDFFERHLLPLGSAWLRRERGLAANAAELLLRRHLGVCFDTCHLSVQFERLEHSLALLASRGIRLSKCQLSAALRAPMTAAAAQCLAAFVDPVYLHQAKVRGPRGGIRAVPDLTRAFLDGWTDDDDARECRIHFHVPLYMPGYGALSSTADELTPAFLSAARTAGVRHFEIETYTFDVLPAALRSRGVRASIVEEYRWVLARCHGTSIKPEPETCACALPFRALRLC
ncbi:MAG: metabolite traffic protein EboE [Kiritimatiellae bacterium]|nr:metabolite traffic protein EboE [Kiritimatiellia bacterium]